MNESFEAENPHAELNQEELNALRRIFDIYTTGAEVEESQEVEEPIDIQTLVGLVINGADVENLLEQADGECREAREYVQRMISSRGYSYTFHLYLKKVMSEFGSDIRRVKRAVEYYFKSTEGERSFEENQFEIWKLGADLRSNKSFGIEPACFDCKGTRDVMNGILSKVPLNYLD